MTYIATVHNAYNGLVYLCVKNGRKPSRKIKIPADPDLIRSALSTYTDLKYRPADDVPSNLKNLRVGRELDIYA